MSILEEATQDFLDSGYPTISYAIARVENALKEIRMVAIARPIDEWDARMKAVAVAALPLQTDKEAIKALNFKATSKLPIEGLLRDMTFAFSSGQIPAGDAEKSIRLAVEAEKNAVEGLERILVMRRNFEIAAGLQSNDEIKRWINAAIAPMPRVVKTWDKRVLFDPDEIKPETEQQSA